MFFWFVRDLFEYHQQSIALVEEGKLEKYYSLRVGHHILMLHPGPPSPPSSSPHSLLRFASGSRELLVLQVPKSNEETSQEKNQE